MIMWIGYILIVQFTIKDQTDTNKYTPFECIWGCKSTLASGYKMSYNGRKINHSMCIGTCRIYIIIHK